jgi:hypothetical protein
MFYCALQQCPSSLLKILAKFMDKKEPIVKKDGDTKSPLKMNYGPITMHTELWNNQTAALATKSTAICKYVLSANSIHNEHSIWQTWKVDGNFVFHIIYFSHNSFPPPILDEGINMISYHPDLTTRG